MPNQSSKRVNPKINEKRRERIIAPYADKKKCLIRFTFLIFSEKIATAAKKKGIIKAPRPKSLDTRKLAQKNPSLPAPFSTGTIVLQTSGRERRD